MEVEMRPLEKSVPELSIRIPPNFQDEDEEEYDEFSDNGSVGIVDWLNEADPDWEQKLQIITVFWSWTVTVRLPENLYNKLVMDVYVLDKIRQQLLDVLIWKNEVRFEVF